MTGRENIFLNGAILGMTKKEISRKLDEIIEFSGCERYVDTPAKRYSSGMKVRLAFAVAAFLEPDILVVDEVFYEDIMYRVPIENLKKSFYKYLNFSKNSHNRFYLLSLRLLDIILSIIGLIILFSIVPFLFFVNLFANKGPLFYSQQRVGKMGKVFKIYKLRSMVVNAELNGAVWAKKNDTRITNFGRLLRSTRCDELPQFYNVLIGDMSIIGPRPERPEFVKELTETIPFYKIRHLIRPGLTGWAQVKYPYANSVKEQEVKLLYDLYYIKQRNIILDFKIIIKTITTVLFYRGQ